jgi:hypothetical protein
VPEQQNPSSTFRSALNEKANPLGYAVLTDARFTLGTSDPKESVRYGVRPFGNEQWSRYDRWFDSETEAETYLDKIAHYPFWTLNVSDPNVSCLNRSQVVITDPVSGEHATIWRAFIGISTGPAGDDLYRVTIKAEEPPTLGQWRRAEF